MKKLIASLLLVCLLTAVFTGCQSTPPANSTPTPTDSSTPVATPAEDLSETGTLNLVWFQGRGTDSLFENPWTDTQSLYPSMVFDTLVKVQEDGKTYTPKLAKEWKISDDGLTYTFYLDTNAKWHDGTPFTEEDVVFSINGRLKSPKSTKGLYTNVVGATEVREGKAETISGITSEPGIVTIKLTVPNSFFMQLLGTMHILPSHLLKDANPLEIDNYEAFWKKPIGTGPYRIDEVSFPNYFTVVRNDDYFGPRPGIRKALFTSYATGGNEAMIAAAVAGKVDYVYGNAVNDINMAKNLESQNTNLKMLMIPSGGGRTFWYNNVGSSDGKYVETLKKPEVRQALGLLIDKETIASFYAGQASIMSASFINPLTPAYNTDIPLFKRDVEKAKQMLTDAGFDFNSTLRLLYYYDDQTTADIMALMKQTFAEAGVKVEPFLAQGDLPSIIYEQKNWDMMYCAAGATDTANAYLFLSPAGAVADKVLGDVEYRAKYTDMLNAYHAASDDAGKQKVLKEIQIEGVKDAYASHVYALSKIVVYNKNKLQLDENVFKADFQDGRDFRFESWKLISK